ncbi:MAG: hypothetical protein ACOC7P_01990 [Chloroflexota bacterium]
MPSLKTHCAISKKRTGFAFAELHKWIDEGTETMGVDHRKKRHYFNRKDQREIKDYWDARKGKSWGEKAIIEWLFHIALDNLETAYKLSLNGSSYGANTYNYIEVLLNPNGYIDCKFDWLPGIPSFIR